MLREDGEWRARGAKVKAGAPEFDFNLVDKIEV
jgi:hypothetical protein